MTHENDIAKAILNGTNLTLVDAARLIRSVLDFMPKGSNLTEAQFCTKIIESGKAHFRINEMSFAEGFNLYYETKKKTLRPDSLRDIRYLANRLMRSNPQLANRNFSELSRLDCEEWLNSTFSTPSQHNKCRSFLHAIFEFALRREWVDKNPIKLIERKKIVEKEIKPLSLEEAKILLKNAKKKNCSEVVGLMMLAGIRPKEAKRIEWNDIDLDENSIRVRSICSKTGGVRHVEICPKLKNILLEREARFGCLSPRNWSKKWKQIRDKSGFKGLWVQDVLRHTYASYFAKRYSDLPRLQLNMGHRDLSLLRSRYVNMSQISKSDAADFFN